MTHPADPRAISAWKKYRPDFFKTRTAGNIRQLARHLDISQAAVSKWTQVPDYRVESTAQFLGVEPWQLRPDIYAPPASPWADLSNSTHTRTK